MRFFFLKRAVGRRIMTKATQEDRHIYGEVDNKTDLLEIFKKIRADVESAKDRPALTELYKRAGYLITLTYAPSWEEKFRDKAVDLRDEAKEEFGKTARAINRRAQQIGTDAD